MDTTPKASSKTHQSRSETTEWRQIEDGRCDSRPLLKKEYFRLYAQTHACVKVVGDMRGKTVNKQELRIHQKRPACQNRYAWRILNNQPIISAQATAGIQRRGLNGKGI